MLIHFHDAAVAPLWSSLNLAVDRGEFIAVLGPNGVGKSTLLGTLMGTRKLSSGAANVHGQIGFIPQQHMFPKDLPVRGRDLVALAMGRRARPEDVDKQLASVGAQSFSERRVGILSGGQQQLIRQAQAFSQSPELLLCDEPLLSLDPARARDTVQRLAEHPAAVVCVTHSINPVMGVVDRVLYLGPEGHVVGSVSEVMRSEVLSELYGTRVDVVEVDGRMVVL